MKLICQYCDKEFETPRRRKTCSPPCAKKLGHYSRGESGAWHEDDKAFLERKAGEMLLPDLVKALNLYRRRHGRSPKSTRTVQRMVYRQGLEIRCTLDNLSMSELALQLGVSRNRVRTWRKQGLKARQISSRLTAIKCKDLAKFMREHPAIAVTINPEQLGLLIGTALAKRLYRTSPPADLKRIRPVVCVETGDRYPSVSSAASANFIHRTSITQAIQRCGRSAGYRWQYVD